MVILSTRKFSSFLSTFMLLAGCGPADSDGRQEHAASAHAARPVNLDAGTHVAPHNMTLFGSASERIYLSHIPLYGGLHNLQVIVEATIASGVDAADQTF